MKYLMYVVLACSVLMSCKNQNRGSDNKIAVATFVDHVVLDKIRDAFLSELEELGYTTENGWQVIVKSANGQPSEADIVADELLNMNPIVIVSISTPSTKPIYDKNQGQIPHVYSFVSFPENIGISESSINTTGLSDGVDFKANIKFIESLIPSLTKLGMVYSDEPNAIVSKDEILKLCQEKGIEFIGQAISKEDEVKQAAQSIVSAGVDAFIIGADGTVVNQVNAMIEVANGNRIPLFAMDEGSVENGAFAALSVNYKQFGRETAKLTDVVIKKKSASGVPQSRYFGNDIVLNIKTSEEIDIEVPDSILNSAYKVIE